MNKVKKFWKENKKKIVGGVVVAACVGVAGSKLLRRRENFNKNILKLWANCDDASFTAIPYSEAKVSDVGKDIELLVSRLVESGELDSEQNVAGVAVFVK